MLFPFVFSMRVVLNLNIVILSEEDVPPLDCNNVWILGPTTFQNKRKVACVPKIDVQVPEFQTRLSPHGFC